MPVRNEVSGEPDQAGNHRFRFDVVTEAHAREAMTWCYDPPYDFYNPPAEPTVGDLASMLSRESPHFAVIGPDDALIGFIGIGYEAQVPGGDYTEGAIDIGIGLRPDWTGRGIGRIVLESFIREADFTGSRLRATIAAFNLRSRRTFEHLGFRETARFRTGSSEAPIEWVVMVKPFPDAV